MEITKSQVEQLRSKGLSDEKIAQLTQERGMTIAKDTPKDFLSTATKVANKLFAGGRVGEAIGTLGGYAYTAGKEKLGLVPKGTTAQYDLSAPSPLQVLGDVARGTAQVVGAKAPVAPSILGKATQFGALGAVSGAGEKLAETGDIKQAAVSGVSEGVKSALVGATFGVLEKGAKALASGAQKAGEKIQQVVIKPTKADFDDGFDIKTLREFNLGGSLKDTFQKTESTLDDLSKELNTKLRATDATIDMNEVYENTAKRLLGNKFESFGANTRMDGALEQLRSEILNVSGNNGLVSVPEAQLVKRASGHFGAWTYGLTDPDSTASQKVYNAFYNEMKKAIEKNSPEGVREINQKMSKLIPVMNAVIRRIPVEQRNSAVSLTDIISLTGATLEPSALSISLVNRLSKSGQVGNILSKTKDVVSPALEGVEKVAQTIVAQ